MESALGALKKRTYQMFLGQVDDELGTQDPSLIQAKFELKFNKGYKDIGKVPGILVDETKRRKLVKELGGEMAKEEEKVAPVSTPQTTSNTLSLVSAMASNQTSVALR